LIYSAEVLFTILVLAWFSMTMVKIWLNFPFAIMAALLVEAGELGAVVDTR